MSDLDRDDTPPAGEEAEAQREQTVMPWVWGGIGVIVAALFIILLIVWRTAHTPKLQPIPPGVTQTRHPT